MQVKDVLGIHWDLERFFYMLSIGPYTERPSWKTPARMNEAILLAWQILEEPDE